jgi:Ca2+-binding RTX toxin-like protein
MSTGVSIFAEPGGFDSRLFFPGMLVLSDMNPQFAPGGTTARLDYTVGRNDYRLDFAGLDFDANEFADFHGIATSASLSKLVNGSYETIATMDIFPETAGQGIIINTATSMTPDGLLNANLFDARLDFSFLGSTGADKLFGSDAGDYFNGEGGRDKLTGYGGKDQFLFDDLGKANADHITDFEIGKDTILIDRSDDMALFKGISAANLKNTFHDITFQAEQRDDRLVYDRHSGALSYDPDGKGGSAPVIIVILDNHAALDWQDFEIF